MDSEKQQLLPDEVYQALSFFRYLRFRVRQNSGSPQLPKADLQWIFLHQVGARLRALLALDLA